MLTLARMEAGQLWYPRRPTLTRLIVALTTSLIIVTGALYNVLGSSERRVDADFLGLVMAALLPSMIFAVGVRTPRRVALYGLLLLGATAFAWFFIFVEEDAMRGVWVLPAFLFGVLRLCSGRSPGSTCPMTLRRAQASSFRWVVEIRWTGRTGHVISADELQGHVRLGSGIRGPG